MSQRWTLNQSHQLDAFTRFVSDRIEKGEKTTVAFCGEGRSVEQNALFHALIRQVAKQKGDESIEEVKRYAKLHFGVPIMREDDGFREKYDRLIKGRLNYEEKLEAMDLIDVSSDMTTEQFSRLIDETTRGFAQQGFEVDTGPYK